MAIVDYLPTTAKSMTIDRRIGEEKHKQFALGVMTFIALFSPFCV